MSNLYVTEPQPNGKVIIDTTAGEIELELWGKEAPKAVRNFLALSMEGYYDNVIFHRIVKGFIVQAGDPTGTGMGGESSFGEPFEDEFHSRLKFNRRGLLGMANNQRRNTNNSQWFITLDRADELTGKHTLFGRVAGNTIFNVLNIGNLEVDEQEKPLIPPKIRGVRIIENPFDDIVPRITAAERRAQQKARAEAKKEAELREKRSRAKKNTTLLSFGEAEEEDTERVEIKKKNLMRPDLAVSEDKDEGPSKRAEQIVNVAPSVKDSDRKEKKAVDLKAIRAEHERQKNGDSATRASEIERMQADLRRLRKQRGEASDSDSDSDAGRKRRRGPSALEQELAKYQKGRGRGARKGRDRKREEDDFLSAEMDRFTKRITETGKGGGGLGRMGGDDDAKEEKEKAEEDATSWMGPKVHVDGLEVDDDTAWLTHELRFQTEKSDETRRAEEEYAVIDPRAKAKELRQGEDARDGHRRARTVADVGRRR
ncbi:Peptidyl-prolyl isomerase cwc27 [Cryptotrichosporon argae]